MSDTALDTHLADERSRAVRLLLHSPLLDQSADPDGFRLVVRHHGWLTDWFETACGWPLVVDAPAGFARLAKRRSAVDAARPLRRARGSGQPFDRRRYQILSLVCAELVRRPVTTIGLLVGAITPAAGLDTARHGERVAVVDALHTLIAWGALQATAGDVDAYAESDSGNAILAADTARLHRLLVGTTPPSRLPDDLDADGEAVIVALSIEPRYGDASDPAGPGSGAADDEQRLRWVRHTLARRLVDDPVTHLDDLSSAEGDYLANPAGRRWLRERVAEAGFVLEERVEGLMAIDVDGLATDRLFPSPQGNTHQLALLLVDRLVPATPEGRRAPVTLSPAALRREVDAILERFPAWAKGSRDGDGPDRLASDAVDLLAGFGLVRIEPDGTVAARPALARYRAGEPVTTGGQPNLFEEPR